MTPNVCIKKKKMIITIISIIILTLTIISTVIKKFSSELHDMYFRMFFIYIYLIYEDTVLGNS